MTFWMADDVLDDAWMTIGKRFGWRWMMVWMTFDDVG